VIITLHQVNLLVLLLLSIEHIHRVVLGHPEIFFFKIIIDSSSCDMRGHLLRVDIWQYQIRILA